MSTILRSILITFTVVLIAVCLIKAQNYAQTSELSYQNTRLAIDLTEKQINREKAQEDYKKQQDIFAENYKILTR